MDVMLMQREAPVCVPVSLFALLLVVAVAACSGGGDGDAGSGDAGSGGASEAVVGGGETSEYAEVDTDAMPAATGDTHVVRGVVEQAGMPLRGVDVGLDGVAAWTARTGADGSFQILGVTAGQHELELLLPSDEEGGAGAFSERTVPITVEGDIDLGALRLPVPVVLEEPTEVDPMVRTTGGQG